MKNIIAAFFYVSFPVNAFESIEIKATSKHTSHKKVLHLKKNVSAMNIENIIFQEIQYLGVMSNLIMKKFQFPVIIMTAYQIIPITKINQKLHMPITKPLQNVLLAQL